MKIQNKSDSFFEHRFERIRDNRIFLYNVISDNLKKELRKLDFDIQRLTFRITR